MHTSLVFACCATGALFLATHHAGIDNDKMNVLNVLEHPFPGGEGVSTLGAGVDVSTKRARRDLALDKDLKQESKSRLVQKPTCNVYHTLALIRRSRTLLV